MLSTKAVARNETRENREVRLQVLEMTQFTVNRFSNTIFDDRIGIGVENWSRSKIAPLQSGGWSWRSHGQVELSHFQLGRRHARWAPPANSQPNKHNQQRRDT